MRNYLSFEKNKNKIYVALFNYKPISSEYSNFKGAYDDYDNNNLKNNNDVKNNIALFFIRKQIKIIH